MPPETETETVVEQDVSKNPRMLAMDAIKVNRDEDDAPTQVADQLALQTDDVPRVLTEGLDRTLVAVKVDGVEQQIPIADVVRSYQKDAAAQARLNEATWLRDQARAAALQKPPAQVDETDTGVDTTANPSAESLGEFVDTLFEGDKDKAVAALAKLGITGRTESPTLDLEQLVAELTPEIRQQIVDDSALERFEEANADLAADPHLVSVTNAYIQEAVNGGMSYIEALEEGANRTRDWLGTLGVVNEPLQPDPGAHQPSKLERKAGIDEVPALNRTANTTQSAPPSPSQVIAEMRKARGQE